MALDKFKAKFGLQVADNTNSSAPSSAKSGYDLLPVGSILYWAGNSGTPPDGWLTCDGSNISRTSYPDLHIFMSGAGYPYGNGDGSTTFTLPDARDRVLIYGSFPTVYSGNSSYTLLDSNISSHTHPLGSHTHPLSSHTHGALTHSHTLTPHTHGTTPGTHPHSIFLSGDHAHTFFATTPTPTGTGQVRNSSTAPTGTKFPAASVDAGSHSHGGTMNPSPSSTGSTSPPMSVSTTTSTGPSASDTGAPSVASTGNNGGVPSTRSSFSLIQPYVVMNVIIKAI